MGASIASAQQPSDSVTSVRAEEVLARVRRFTASDVALARALADSLVSALPGDASILPQALFAKAAIASSAADAERDYSRIVNEFRFSARVPDALMRLAVLESARNNRAGALRHLDQLLRDHGDAPARSRASLLAGRLRLEGNDPARGCELLAAAYAAAGPLERDVRDQAVSLGATCPTPIATIADGDATPMGVVRGQPRVVVGAPPVASSSTSSSRRGTRRDTTARRDSASRSRRPVATVVTKPVAQPPAVAQPVETKPAAPTAVTPMPVVIRGSVPAAATPAPGVSRPAAPAPVAGTPAPVVSRPAASAPVAGTPAPVVTTPAAAAPVAQKPASPAPTPANTAPSTAAPTAAASAPQTARFAVQFAAYNDRPGAESYAALLRGRGITARVEGSAAPFRVRAGRFATRQEAEASAVLWRRPGQAAIVVSLGTTP